MVDLGFLSWNPRITEHGEKYDTIWDANMKPEYMGGDFLSTVNKARHPCILTMFDGTEYRFDSYKQAIESIDPGRRYSGARHRAEFCKKHGVTLEDAED